MILYTSSEDTEVLPEGSSLALVYFSAEDCSMCKSLKPKIEAVLEEYPGVEAYEVNLTKTIGPSARYSVFVVPAVLLFTEGKESKRFAGIFAIGELRDTIQRYSELLNKQDNIS